MLVLVGALARTRKKKLRRDSGKISHPRSSK